MPEMSILIPMAAFLLAIGALAGVVSGLLGVGGGIVLVPAFYYAFSALGYESDRLMQVCLGTSLATIVFTSIRSTLLHNRRGAVDWSILRAWAPGLAIGAAVGVAAAAILHSQDLQVIFGVLGLVVAFYLGLGRAEWRIGPQMPGGLTLAILSPLMGFLSVLMGIGGGSFGVPTMTLYGVPIHRAVATASGFGVIIALPSTIGFLLMEIEHAPPYTVGAVNLVAFVLIVATTLLTTGLGVRLAHAMNPKPLRRVFAAFLALVALNMIRKALGY